MVGGLARRCFRPLVACKRGRFLWDLVGLQIAIVTFHILNMVAPQPLISMLPPRKDDGPKQDVNPEFRASVVSINAEPAVR